MNIEITGRNVDVTPAMRTFTEERLAKLQKLLDEPLDAHVVIWIAKHRHAAEIQVKARNLLLTGSEETDDLYVTISEVVDKLERQALKHKTKVRDHKHRQSPRDPEIAAAISAVAAAEAGGGVELAEEPTRPRIIRSQRYRVKPMTVEDAVLELEGTGEDLLVFREAESYRLQVVHRARDGNYALVDPDL